MKKILVISDIHANKPALEAVLEDAGQFDAAWCLGDLIGYGPDPNECIKIIRSLPNLVCLMGNHDAAVLGQIGVESFNHEASQAAIWTKETLTEESMAYLRELPEMQTVEDATLAHGSPRNPVWEYLLDTYTAEDNFNFFETRICLVGHTHIPLAYMQIEGQASVILRQFQADEKLFITDRTILNPGSVGQPRDYDPRAAYAIYKPEENIWESHRVEYDIESVQQRILEAGLPQRHAERLAFGW